MTNLAAGLRQWCKVCQAATTSILCELCPGQTFICAGCRSDHDQAHADD